MKRYFSSESSHGRADSYGFSNDTIVRVFSSRGARDEYVKASNNLSCKSIRASEATRHATNYALTQNRNIAPRPFTGEYWGIVDWTECPPDGQIGTLEVAGAGSNAERFYKS